MYEQCLADWQEDRVVVLIKQLSPWEAARARGLSLETGIALDAPLVPTLEAFERLSRRAEGMGEAVYAVGGGVAADAAKFVASTLGLPLVCVPTALSCIAFFTPYVLLRQLAGMTQAPAVPPDGVLLDLALIRAAPTKCRASGIVDVLSMATACLDWLEEDRQGKLPPEQRYAAPIAQMAQSLVEIGLECAPSAHRGEWDGLRALARCLALTAHLGTVVGHERFRIGSAHAFAEQAEQSTAGASWRGELLPSPFTYAQRLAAGVLHAASRQGQDIERLRRALTTETESKT
ncbi:MAG: iron-containing alcohol dehydrogenase [Anaerolineae bacterium]|nr:iron-containing alcohol dehydrogenase [Thermoflexales bacterium]MDW8395025.1 iron-containing alcohol dehydrogenase [Anaerolineae bacterium]